MVLSSMAPASTTHRGLERSGMDTRSVGDGVGAHVGHHGMTGVLPSDSVGVGGDVGDAIPGGAAAITMVSSQQGGLTPLPQPEAFTRERVAQRPARAASLAQIPVAVLPAPTILAPERWPPDNAQRCRTFPIIINQLPVPS
jgi:hypothetical protein